MKDHPLNARVKLGENTFIVVREFIPKVENENKCKYCVFRKIDRNSLTGGIHGYECALEGINTKCGINNQEELKRRYRRDFESNLRADGKDIVYKKL